MHFWAVTPSLLKEEMLMTSQDNNLIVYFCLHALASAGVCVLLLPAPYSRISADSAHSQQITGTLAKSKTYS